MDSWLILTSKEDTDIIYFYLNLVKRKFLKFQSSDLKIDDNLKDFDITFEDGIFNDPLGLNLIISVIGVCLYTLLFTIIKSSYNY